MYDVKLYLTFKAHLVYDGIKADPCGLSARTTVVQGCVLRLLDLITSSQNLEALTGDIGNNFIQTHTRSIYILDVDLKLSITSIQL